MIRVPRDDLTPAWRPTIAHLRATTCGLTMAIIAVLMRRPDLLVIAAPLLVISGWSAFTRPRRTPAITEGLHHGTVREGEATAWWVDVRTGDGDPQGDGRSEGPGLVSGGGAEEVTVVLGEPPFTVFDPPSGAVAVPVEGDRTEVSIGVRSTRWGRRGLGPAKVSVTSSWAAFRWETHAGTPKRMTTLPVPAVFDAHAPLVHPVGLVGLHRSARAGDGSEFASIRPFQVGDRLRRIHWSRSLRSGELHVTSTWADQDSHVVLLVDALNDLGVSGGIDGAASSLDTTVRAAGAIAEHHLRSGDRVSLLVTGTRGIVRVPPAAGVHHLRRVLDVLAAIEVGTDHRSDRLHAGTLTAGALVVMLSPLASPSALQRAMTLARRGVTVVVIDTLPADVVDEDPQDPYRALAWRIRLLERRREIRLVQEAGVPVVSWRGPGSLDQVLRDLHRRSGAPRLVRR